MDQDVARDKKEYITAFCFSNAKEVNHKSYKSPKLSYNQHDYKHPLIFIIHSIIRFSC